MIRQYLIADLCCYCDMLFLFHFKIIQGLVKVYISYMLQCQCVHIPMNECHFSNIDAILFFAILFHDNWDFTVCVHIKPILSPMVKSMKSTPHVAKSYNYSTFMQYSQVVQVPVNTGKYLKHLIYK